MHWKRWVLTTRPPGKSLCLIIRKRHNQDTNTGVHSKIYTLRSHSGGTSRASYQMDACTACVLSHFSCVWLCHPMETALNGLVWARPHLWTDPCGQDDVVLWSWVRNQSVLGTMWFPEGKFKFCHGDGHWAGKNKTLTPPSLEIHACIRRKKREEREPVNATEEQYLGCRT